LLFYFKLFLLILDNILKPLGQDLKNNTGHFLVNNGGLFGLITGGKPLFGKREAQETKGVATDFLVGNLFSLY
jgi:hypothetical protein